MAIGNSGTSDAAEPFRQYAGEDRRLTFRLSHSLREKIEIETGALIGGLDASFDEIRRRQGYIAGLQWALQECERTSKEING